MANGHSESEPPVMKIHALKLGTVQIHSKQVVGQGDGFLRTVNMLRDPQWTPPLPILAWAIEHPEGVIVVDTGYTARCVEPNFHPRWHPYYRSAVRFSIRPEDEIGPQLLKLGIAPSDVRTVVMTHMHSDHAGGLSHFPKSEILVHPLEMAATRGPGGWIAGYLPQHYPLWFQPKPIKFSGKPFGAFPDSQMLTRAGDVVIVPTFGHTPSHVSVMVVSDRAHYMLAGDTSYTEANLRAGLVDGVSPNVSESAATMQTILNYARANPLVYLPTHEMASLVRLEKQTWLA